MPPVRRGEAMRSAWTPGKRWKSRIASICAQVAGAGDVRVIVSLAGG